MESEIEKTRKNMIEAGWEYLGGGIYVPGPELRELTRKPSYWIVDQSKIDALLNGDCNR